MSYDSNGNFIVFVGSLHLFNHKKLRPIGNHFFEENVIIPGIVESLHEFLKSKNCSYSINFFDLKNVNELYLQNISSLNDLEEKTGSMIRNSGTKLHSGPVSMRSLADHKEGTMIGSNMRSNSVHRP